MKSVLMSLCLVIYILFNNGDVWKIDKANDYKHNEYKYTLQSNTFGWPVGALVNLLTFPDSLNEGVLYIGTSSKDLYSAVLKKLDGETAK